MRARLFAIALWLALSPCWPSLVLAQQNFDFHPQAVSVADPATPGVMRDLAERILPVYQEDNPERYLANLSVLQLVAGNYTAAYESRQSLRDRRRSADAGKPVNRSVILDLFARARAIEATDRLTFAQAYTQAYKAAVPKLNDLDAYTLMSWLTTPPAWIQEPTQRLFDQARAKGHLTLPEAMDLMQAYLNFDAYRSVGPIVAALDTEEEQRRYEIADDVLIRTRDGINIAAVLVRPKATQAKLPTLLEFTPYITPGDAREVAAHGYVGVVAYARGRGKSTGKPTSYQYDGDDARAVIDWIAKQPWSDGRVGMYGTAYSGFTGWAAAKHLPPALQAIAATSPTVPGFDIPDDGAVMRNWTYRWSLWVTNVIDDKTYYDDAPWRDLDLKWYAAGKPYRDLGRLYGKPDLQFLRWLAHPGYDVFWQKMVPYDQELAKINIPVLTITGYYGVGEAGALYYFTHDPGANHTLLVGPYDDGVTQHGVPAIIRGYGVDPAAFVDLRELRYQWFDSVFKGTAVPALLKDRVNFEVMGANEWRHVPSLEAMGNGVLQWTLDSTSRGASHRLTPHEVVAAGAQAVAGKAGAGKAGAKGVKAGKPQAKGKSKGKPADPGYVELTVNLADRKDIDSNWVAHPDIVSRTAEVRNATAYVSDPLAKPLELQGAWSGHLDLTINKSDVDLRLTAYELLATGDYVQLFEPYVLRASYAQDRVTRHPLKPGERQKIEFKIERLTSRRLQAGSRLVWVVGVNERPDQEINYGSGGDVAGESAADEQSKVPVKIRWWNDSYIETAVVR